MSPSRALDQFYTQPSVAKSCLEFLGKHISPELFSKAVFLEPSAGTGSFFKLLPNRAFGFDLEPKCEGVIQQNFLDFSIDTLFAAANEEFTEPVITVGNPPFGKNSSLALKFINIAAKFSSHVAFVLPNTFRKDSMLNKIDRHLHLVAELPLGSDSFEFDGQPYNVPCVFQVWERRSTERAIVQKSISHPDFNFVRKTDDHDFAIRRVGGLAGKVITPETPDYQKYSPASHYYIKANPGRIKECLAILSKEVNWDAVKYNTAGNPSVSKRELVFMYHEALKARAIKKAA